MRAVSATGLTSLAVTLPLGEVEHDRCRSLVEKLLDELYERVRILKACPWVESTGLEDSLSPWTRRSIHLAHTSWPSRLPPISTLARPGLSFTLAGSLPTRRRIAEVTAREDIATVARQLAALTQTVEEMAGQLKEVRERAENERERTDVQQERIDLAARELSDVSDRLQAAANALRESI